MTDFKTQQINPNKGSDWSEKFQTGVDLDLDIQTDKSLYGTFNKDWMASYHSNPQSTVELSQEETKTVSFWSKIAQLLPRKATEIQPNPVTASTEISSAGKIEAIDRTPVLDSPDPLINKLLQKHLESKEPLPMLPSQEKRVEASSIPGLETKEEILAFISSIKDLMEKVFHLMKEQLKLENEQGEVSQEALEKFQKIKKELEKILDKLADDLKKEQDVSKYIGYVQGALGVATAACTLIGIVSAFIPGGQITALPIATAIGGVAAALATGTKAFFDARGFQHQAETDAMQFSQMRNKNMMKDCLDQISNAVDISSQIQELLIKMIKANDRTKRAVITY
jgi:hypothetical protein